ncbi:hypothetical protein JHK85_049170 [Glycine max]|nr:hypothetical protein JHK85_049170 [Glycine max]
MKRSCIGRKGNFINNILMWKKILGQSMQEQFENSAAGRAARAQQQAMAKQSANANKGEPVLKVQPEFYALHASLVPKM